MFCVYVSQQYYVLFYLSILKSISLLLYEKREKSAANTIDSLHKGNMLFHAVLSHICMLRMLLMKIRAKYILIAFKINLFNVFARVRACMCAVYDKVDDARINRRNFQFFPLKISCFTCCVDIISLNTILLQHCVSN